jgi:hypothetical protein
VCASWLASLSQQHWLPKLLQQVSAGSVQQPVTAMVCQVYDEDVGTDCCTFVTCCVQQEDVHSTTDKVSHLGEVS